MQHLQHLLELPTTNLGPLAKPKRTMSIKQAQAWHSGTQDDRHYVKVFASGEYAVALGKPGKEAAEGYSRPNPHDMAPTVFFEQRALPFFPTFRDIFRDIQHLGAAESGDQRESVLEVMAALFFRSSFMLDHEERAGAARHEPAWHWQPPREAIDFLTSSRAEMGPPICTQDGRQVRLPTAVYLQLVDALAWNEDVKYQAAKVDSSGAVSGNTGRPNTLQTCASLIAVFLDRYAIYDFTDAVIRGKGVAQMTRKAAEAAFPLLAPRVTA